MRNECIEAVGQAIGRSITQREAQAIESRILANMREIARKDPATWRGMGQAARLSEAAKLAAQQLQHEAAKGKQRVALTILAHDKVMNRYQSLTAGGVKPFQAVARILDDANRFAKGVSQEYFSGLIDTMEAVAPRFLGMVENAGQAADLVREIFGEGTGNAAAKKGAQAWLQTVEAMRERFNAAGGDVGRLDYGYLPQPHDDLRILKAGADQWAQDTLPLLDRSRYVDADGNRLNDDQMADMLASAWETITTGGENKREPGQYAGRGIRAARGSAHRAIHFKDAASYLEYAAKYNKGGVLSAVQGHVGRLARDIALLEEFGPNPNTQWQFLHDTATRSGEADLVGPFLVSTGNMWDVLNGNTGLVGNPRLAEVAQGARNVEVFSKLGKAFISSVTDVPTYFVTTGFNRLGFGESLVNMIRSFGPDTADYANRAGLIGESVISDMNRWAEDNIGTGWTGKLSNATMKVTLLSGWTDALRRGFTITMMGAMGKLTRGTWQGLTAGDRARMERVGVTETDFNVWRLAAPENWRGSQMLTVQALRAVTPDQLESAGYTQRDLNRAVSRLLGVITDESEYASVGQDLQTRAAVTRGTKKGTVEGEFLRSIMLFKGFPMAVISRHLGRMVEQWKNGDKVSSLAYSAGLGVGLTAFGAVAVQLKDLLNGKDPRDMSTAKFWGAAFAQGGGLGIFGDVLYTGMGGDNRAGLPNWMNLLGPVVGSAFEAVDLTAGNVGQAMQGKDTHIGAEAVRFATSHAPLVNLWYTKAAIDHAFLQDIQEYLSPGYMRRMRTRAAKDWGQQYWWAPGQGMPSRAPDVSQMGGR
ncbi:MAG: hypothetical protein KUL86_06960 [Castellaniella sp.]|nr:hypothetical protein [Castellaniella sp.]